MFTGNRPENCGDVSNPRVHPKITIPHFKLYAWLNNNWESCDIINNTRKSLALVEEFTIDIDPIRTYQIKIEAETEKDIYINELQMNGMKEPVHPSNYEIFVYGKNMPQQPIIPAQQNYVMELLTGQARV